MSLQILKKQLNNKQLSNLYLFYGPEKYLKKYYLQRIEKQIIMDGTQHFNKITFEDITEPDSVIEACETMPFMSEKKMVIVKNFDLLKRKSQGVEKLVSFIENIPEYTCLLFYEYDNIDRRIKPVKKIKEKGLIVEYKYQRPQQLAKWVIKIFKNSSKIIDYSNALTIVEYCGPAMDDILNEVNKIIMYMGDRKKVVEEYIETVCTKCVRVKIFDLLDAIFEKNKSKSIMMLYDMLNFQEPLIKILFMITRQLRHIMELKLMIKEGIEARNAASKIGIPHFTVKRLLGQIENYDIKTLKQAMEECLIIDAGIKTGKLNPQTAVEMFIIKYST